MDTFKDVLFFFIGLLLFIFSVVIGICSIGYYGGTRPACEQYGRLTGAEISTQFFGDGCLVKYEGRWVDYSVATQKKSEVKVTQ